MASSSESSETPDDDRSRRRPSGLERAAALFSTLRPRQWTKNLVVLAPLVFAARLSDYSAVTRAVSAAAVFCLLSGAVYLLNDLLDLEQDRLHPTKRRRPLASGQLVPAHAWVAFAFVLTLGIASAALLSPELITTVSQAPAPHDGPVETQLPSFLSLSLLYLALQFSYTLHFKHVVIVDVMIIAIGFVLRASAGAVVIAVEISPWLLVCTIFLSLFLALAKRRHEFVLLDTDASQHRRTLGEYDAHLLDQMIGIVASACVLSYALYTLAPETVAKFRTTRLNLTIPFVVYGLFRYLFLVHRREDGGDPSASLINDRPLLAAVLVWALVVIAVVYY